MLSPIQLIHIQLELECIGVTPDGFLYRIPGENPDDLHRFFVARHAQGYIVYFGRDLEPSIVRRLQALQPVQPFEDIPAVRRILYGNAESDANPWLGRAYTFETTPSPAEYPDAIAEGDSFVVRVGGQVAARAWSSRSNTRAAELAVETVPEFRRRGYGRQAAAAWAAHQLAVGRVAFYSHHRDNLTSLALARSLGVVQFMDAAGYP